MAQKIVHTLGTALTGFITLTGKPPLSMITNACPALIASAAATATPTPAYSPTWRIRRAPEASQNAMPKDMWAHPGQRLVQILDPSTKCAWPTMTFMSPVRPVRPHQAIPP